MGYAMDEQGQSICDSCSVAKRKVGALKPCKRMACGGREHLHMLAFNLPSAAKRYPSSAALPADDDFNSLLFLSSQPSKTEYTTHTIQKKLDI
jgi:hypothetical protein